MLLDGDRGGGRFGAVEGGQEHAAVGEALLAGLPQLHPHLGGVGQGRQDAAGELLAAVALPGDVLDELVGEDDVVDALRGLDGGEDDVGPPVGAGDCDFLHLGRQRRVDLFGALLAGPARLRLRGIGKRSQPRRQPQGAPIAPLSGGGVEGADGRAAGGGQPPERGRAGVVAPAGVGRQDVLPAEGVGPGVGGPGALDDFAGALVDAGLLHDPAQFAVAAAVAHAQAAGADLALGEGPDAAAAVPAVGGVVGVPDGVVGAEHGAVEGGVGGAGARVLPGGIHPVGAAGDVGGLGLLAGGGVGGAHVGVEDGAQAPGRAEPGDLDPVRAGDHLPAPPAEPPQLGLDPAREAPVGLAFSQRPVEGGPQGGEDVEAHGLGDGEGARVGGLPDLPPVPRDGVALAPEVLDGVARRQAGGVGEVDGLRHRGQAGGRRRRTPSTRLVGNALTDTRSPWLPPSTRTLPAPRPGASKT